MSKYKITDNDKGLKIEISEIAGEQQQLLGEFQKCQQGQCTCPTDEYKKLEGMELKQNDEGIQIQLIVKADEKFDKEEITRCLDYTTQKSKK